jgi:hypothetical protein
LVSLKKVLFMIICGIDKKKNGLFGPKHVKNTL